MPTSLNGWPVLKPGDSHLVTRTVPGTTRRITMRREVIPLFLAFAAEYHKKIAPIDKGTFDDWGYAYRQARAASRWSDHSSGTALDINAAHEGAQGTRNYSWWRRPVKYLQARRLKAKYGLLWGGSDALGGDYHQSKYWDWMHWAIRPGTSLAQVNARIKKLGIRPDGTVGPKPKPVVKPTIRVRDVQPGKSGYPVKVLQKALKAEGLYSGPIDGVFSRTVKLAYMRWQVRCGYKGADADGRPGLASMTLLGKKRGFTAVN